MSDSENRLVDCFSAVFPALSHNEIRFAQRENIAGWDSLASITLLSVIQEQFKVDIDLLDMDKLGSFKSVLDYIERRRSEHGDGDAAVS